MRALYHQIRTLPDGGIREEGPFRGGQPESRSADIALRYRRFFLSEVPLQAEMRPMGLVHQQGNAMGMTALRDTRNVRDDALVGGTGQHHRLRLRIPREQCFDGFRADAAAKLEGRIIARQRPMHMQAPQLQGMQHRAMTVPGRNDLTALPGCRKDRRQISAGAAVHQIPCAVGVVQLRGSVHSCAKNPLRRMQIIGARHLREIDLVGEHRGRCQTPLMTGHMQGIELLPEIMAQLCIQIFVVTHFPLRPLFCRDQSFADSD